MNYQLARIRAFVATATGREDLPDAAEIDRALAVWMAMPEDQFHAEMDAIAPGWRDRTM